MKKRLYITALLIGLALFISNACATSGSVETNASNQEPNNNVDSLEQARVQRLDSSTQIQSGSNVPSKSISTPSKVIKKKVIKD